MLLHQQEFTDYQQMRPHGYTSTRVSLLVNLECRWQRMLGSLYILSTDEIFTSDNNGETWTTLGIRPKGDAVGLVIIDTERASTPQAPITMYLALKDEGIFRSTDGRTQWNLLKDGLTVSEKISAVAAVGKTVFAGTENSIYRLDSGVWKKLPLDTSGAVCSLTVSGNNLYVGTGSDLLVRLTSTELYELKRNNRLDSEWNNKLYSTKIFHSDDLGASWTEIMQGRKYTLRRGTQRYNGFSCR